MTRPEKALSLFREGFSCSQAVFTAFAEEMGLPRDAALRVSQAFGGGLAKSGDWCGAVTGAFLVIGLKYGRTRAADAAAKDKTYALVQEFIHRFRSRNQALRCRDLLGCDIATPEGEKAIEEGNLHERRCEPLVKDAAEILEDIL
jgi:C_GCAxxG_C_C family probable redox protein